MCSWTLGFAQSINADPVVHHCCFSHRNLYTSFRDHLLYFEMPVTTRQQANRARQAHAVSHLNINNLPAEIIEEIAFHLTPDSRHPQETETHSSGFDDIDHDRMSVTSLTEEEGPPDVEVMPCCRPRDQEADWDEEADWYASGIPILDERSTFSATSKRIRDIVFHRRQTRRRTIRYCNQWVFETQDLPLAVRSRYT